jgi:hypothetical protein
MQLLKVMALALMLVLVASAADVTGTWTGTFVVTTPDGKTQDDSVHMVLKQEGGKITGTAGPAADEQMPIQKGTIEGTKIAIEVAVPNGSFKFDLTLDADHLKGDVTATNGTDVMKAKMDATRAK